MHLPPFALWILPVFAALIALEVLWSRRARRAYPWRDSLASLGVWLGRFTTGLACPPSLAFGRRPFAQRHL